jgi:GTPase SAR1 family protein
MLTNPIQTGPQQTAKKIVIQGPESVGKTTLASAFPRPLFLDCEGGTKALNVARIPVTDADTLEQVLRDVSLEDAQTLIIDTCDWAERLVLARMLKRSGQDDIESYGYGKGYAMIEAEMSRILALLDEVIARGIHVVLLAHSQINKFEDPSLAHAYDRWSLKLSKKVAPVVKEWCDLLLFLNFRTHVAIDANTKRKRGAGGKERIIFTEHDAAHDAKSRWPLPAEMQIGPAGTMPAELSDLVAASPQPAETGDGPLGDQALLKSATEVFDGTVLTDIQAKFAKEIASKGNEAVINAFLFDRGEIKETQEWMDAREDYLERAAKSPQAFIDALIEFNAPLTAPY